MTSLVADSASLLARAASLPGSVGASAASTTDGTSAFDDLVAATLAGGTGSAVATAPATTTEIPTLAGGVMTVVVPTEESEGATTVGQGASTDSSAAAAMVGTLLPVTTGKETGGVDLIGDWTSTEAPETPRLSSGVATGTQPSDTVAAHEKATGGVDVVGDWTSTEAPVTFWSPSATVESQAADTASAAVETSPLWAVTGEDALSSLLQQASYTATAYRSLLRLGQSADVEA